MTPLAILAVCALSAAIGAAVGYRLGSPTVVLQRQAEWIERGGIRERLSWTAEHVRQLLDRLAAVERDRCVLIDLLRAYRIEEHGSVERELRVVRT